MGLIKQISTSGKSIWLTEGVKNTTLIFVYNFYSICKYSVILPTKHWSQKKDQLTDFVANKQVITPKAWEPRNATDQKFLELGFCQRGEASQSKANIWTNKVINNSLKLFDVSSYLILSSWQTGQEETRG